MGFIGIIQGLHVRDNVDGNCAYSRGCVKECGGGGGGCTATNRGR